MTTTTLRTGPIPAMLLLSAFGCAANPAPAPEAEPEPASSAPSWIERGSGAFEIKGQRVFLGVGEGPKKAALTAEKKARDAIAEIYRRFMRSSINAALASYVTPTAQNTEMDSIYGGMEELNAASLGSITIAEQWTDPKTDSVYVLAQLPLNDVLEAIERNGTFDGKVKFLLPGQADSLHDDLITVKPEWVDEKTGFVQVAGRRMFQAVGSSPMRSSAGSTKRHAQDVARAKVHELFEVYVAALLEAYPREPVEGTTKALKQATRWITRLEAHWRRESDGAVFALAQLKLDDFVKRLAHVDEIPAEFRAFAVENAEVVFDSLPRSD